MVNVCISSAKGPQFRTVVHSKVQGVVIEERTSIIKGTDCSCNLTYIYI